MKFLLVDHLPPSTQSPQFAEQSDQTAVLQVQLMDFFLTAQVQHISDAHFKAMSLYTRTHLV